jgi:hypothetical protein
VSRWSCAGFAKQLLNSLETDPKSSEIVLIDEKPPTKTGYLALKTKTVHYIAALKEASQVNV